MHQKVDIIVRDTTTVIQKHRSNQIPRDIHQKLIQPSCWPNIRLCLWSVRECVLSVCAFLRVCMTLASPARFPQSCAYFGPSTSSMVQNNEVLIETLLPGAVDPALAATTTQVFQNTLVPSATPPSLRL